MQESPKADFQKVLLETIINSIDKCENCNIRPKAKKHKWCWRCINRYRRLQRTDEQIQNEILWRVPQDYLMADLKDHPELEMWNFQDNLYFWGETGRVKTWAIFALMKKAIIKGYSICRIEFTDLCSEIRSTFNRGSKRNENQIIKELTNWDILFVDDLGLLREITDYDYEVLYRILDGRLMDCLPTVIASNRSVEDIGLIFGKRIASRLKKFEIIKFEGEDRRGQK